MKKMPPAFTRSRTPVSALALHWIGGFLLLAFFPGALSAQSVSFSGTQTTLVQGTAVSSEPYGTAVDQSGNVFFDSNGTLVNEILISSGYTTVTTLNELAGYPLGMAIDGNDNIFITDGGLVQELLATGGYITIDTLGSGFQNPFDVALDGSGNVFVADTFHNAVKEIIASSGYTTVVTLGGDFDSPQAVAVDGSGNVFVADTGNNAVKEIVAAGGYTTVKTLATGFDLPAGIAVDGSENLFVADTGNNAVKELLAAGGYETAIVVARGLDAPNGVALDLSGNLFVADTINDRIEEVQRTSVDFGNTGLCEAGSLLCSKTLALNYAVTSSATLGTPIVLTGGAANLDFTLAGGSTCSGAVAAGGSCVVNVAFAPTAIGARSGTVQIVDSTGDVIATTVVSGDGQADQGFSVPGTSIQLNGAARLDGSRLQLTRSGQISRSASAFYATPVNVAQFTTDFAFQLTDPSADGFTFTIQNVGPKALGSYGAGLGYATIGESVAVKFDLHNNAGEGPDSTGLYVDGAVPTVPAVPLNAGGANATNDMIDLHSGHVIAVGIVYDGTHLHLTLTDNVTLQTWTYEWKIDIPGTVGGQTAYVGFTGGTGRLSADQEILSWTFSNP